MRRALRPPRRGGVARLQGRRGGRRDVRHDGNGPVRGPASAAGGDQGLIGRRVRPMAASPRSQPTSQRSRTERGLVRARTPRSPASPAGSRQWSRCRLGGRRRSLASCHNRVYEPRERSDRPRGQARRDRAERYPGFEPVTQAERAETYRLRRRDVVATRSRLMSREAQGTRRGARTGTTRPKPVT
jgi:hypothetical protein